VPLKFHKMHGAGNDFVLLDLRVESHELTVATAAELADRHTGVGCDQVLVLRPASTPGCLASFEVWNADGSRAEQCGNGVRCIGLYLKSNGETPAGPFLIQGPVSTISLEAMPDSRFRVDMGPPAFDSADIPIALEPSDGTYELEAAGRILNIRAVSMGNPHAVLVVPDVTRAAVSELGPAISSHPAFPQACNAGFAEIVDRNTIKLRVFERGAAETMACGSGACAAAVSLIKAGELEKEVVVNQKGGSLVIEWPNMNRSVMMTGPAVYTFTGMLS
jgi:diaminopimelate epimerase